jgi:glucose-1-phosphate adenylyltransferase
MAQIVRPAPLARDALAYVLAGGRGSRLMELTDKRAKPAVFFGGKTRIIDFALSNAVNSGIRRIAVATQYRAHSLIRHLQRGWNFLRPERNESFDILPASQRLNENLWYAGTADAVYQNIDIVRSYRPEHIVVLAGDHIYKMDYELMLQQHVNSGADVTVGCLEVPRMEATGFGVMHVDADDRVVMFLEKDLIPYIVKHGKAVAHRFTQSCVRSAHEPQAYWRDVGTVDAYWEANIDLTDIVPALDLFDRSWPIWTNAELIAPAKFVHDEDGRRGMAVSSVVSGGCIVSGAALKRTLLFTGVRVNSYSSTEDAVILPYVEIGRNVHLKKVVVDRGVHVPEGLVVGEDPEFDAARFRRTENGICLITQKMITGATEVR